MRLITDLDALEWAHKLAAQEGILIGISDGAFSAIAIEAAEQKEPMSKVLYAFRYW